MTDATTIDFAAIAPRERYKLLCATIMPRPIALVTTISPDGVVNAAPFSFFNVFSEDPALVVLGLQHKPANAPKDTTRNIAETGAFVVNLVDEDLAEAMNICAIDFLLRRARSTPPGSRSAPGSTCRSRTSSTRPSRSNAGARPPWCSGRAAS